MSWLKTEFKTIDLEDARLNRRAVKIIEAQKTKRMLCVVP